MENVECLSLTLSAVTHATEDKKKVLQAMAAILPENARVESTSRRAKGYYGNEILAVNMRIVSPAHAELCFAGLWRNLEMSDRELIQSRLEEFTDSAGSVFLRVDKEESYRGRILLGKHETIKVEARFSGHKMPRKLLLESIEKWMKTIHNPIGNGRSDCVLET